MTITMSSVGANGDTTGATSIVITIGAGGFTLGQSAWAILCLAYDNAGASGADPYSSISDSLGNTWTSRQAALYDPGAASAGVTLRIFTSDMAVRALGVGDTVTVSFGANSVASKAWCFQEALPGPWGTMSYVTGGVSVGSASAAPTITTGSIAQNDVVIGAGAAESADTWVADADTTNGNWSAKQSFGAGSGATGMSVVAQRKVVTAAGAQTFNPTLTSADCILAWIQLHETIAVGVPSLIVPVGAGVAA